MTAAGWALATALFAFPLSCAKDSGPVIELGAGFGEFSVRTLGDAVSLNTSVAIEQKTNGKWARVNVTNLYLRESCDASQPPQCRRLEANSKVTAVRWRGNFCWSQCPAHCRLDGPAPPGTYRFVVTSCNGKQMIASPEFEKK